MNRFFIVFAASILFFSCQKKEEKKVEIKKDSTSCSTKPSKGKEFEMYQMSEMAALMEQMYVENLALKERIVKGEKIGNFPDYFLEIYTSKFTDESDNDAFFKQNAKVYIKAQQVIYSDEKEVENSKT
ncbi:hypothetical protein [Flavobacterium sp.]|uniref:hypothetical protein n=1 Tax=Flavobacterium sp. TaxID=239 RepID=UPI0037507C57